MYHKSSVIIEKENLVHTLRITLTKANVHTNGGDNLLDSLVNLPENNLHKMIAMSYDGISCLQTAYQKWGQMGYLKFKSYVTTENEIPTLTVRHDVHLCLSNDKYFQAMRKPQKSLEMECGSIHIEPLLKFRSVDTEEWLQQNILVGMMCYAAFIDIGFHYDNVRNWFVTDTDQADAYIHSVFEHNGRKLSYVWSDIEKYIHVECDERISNERKLYRIIGHGGTICEFAFGEETIQVMVSDLQENITTLWTLDLPPHYGIIDSTWCSSFNSNCIAEIVYGNIGSTTYRRDLMLLTIMLLKLAGIHINWLGSYALRKMNTVRPTNCPNVITVETLSDIYAKDPDKF